VVGLCEAGQPDLLLLDLQMPDPNGLRVLELLANEIHGPTRLPVLVLTADITAEARKQALSRGARDFVTKPFDATEVELRVQSLLETRRLQLELQRYNDTLEERVRERTRDLNTARLETLERLALAAEYRDDNTHEHAQRVGRTVAMLAARMGQPPDEVELIRRAAPLHDIGKIGIPDAILLKPAPLDSYERELMQTHTVIGHQILTGSASLILELSAEIALTHHERWDGRGYPHGRAGDEIAFAGRLTAVADVFDALTHRRPYKEAWPLDATLSEIRLGARRHFDPTVIEAFETLDATELLSPIGRAASGGWDAPKESLGAGEAR
jgi:putative two-component system response regulator